MNAMAAAATIASNPELQARGADVAERIASRFWGMREFSVRDLDGNVVRIAHGERSLEGIRG